MMGGDCNMMHTCAVSHPYGLAHSHEKAAISISISAATLPLQQVCSNQLSPLLQNSTIRDGNHLHPQFQKPWQFTDDFAYAKDGGFEIARESACVDTFTSEYRGNSAKENQMPMNVFKATEKPINGVTEFKALTHAFEADASSWSSIISANLRAGQNRQAIELYQKMRGVKVKPDTHVFVAVLKACSQLANLEYGQQVQAHAVESGLEMDAYIGDVLIDLYAKCGDLELAHVMFDRLPAQDMVTWSLLISVDIQHGRNEEALSLFQCLAHTEEEMSSVVYILAVKACTNLRAIEKGKQLHIAVVENGLESDTALGNSLINMYTRSWRLEDASMVLSRLPKADVISWNTVIEGYIHNGYCYQAIEIFERMLLDGLKPDHVSYMTILKACSKVKDIKKGIQYHVLIVKGGFDLDCFVCSALVDMYVKCGILEDGRKVLYNQPKHDSIVWGALIAGYTELGKLQQALQLFEQMMEEGVQASAFTVKCLLKVCGRNGSLKQGQWLHSLVMESGFESDLYVGNLFIYTYMQSGSLEDAQKVFDQMTKRDVVSWSNLISGYAHHGDFETVFLLFFRMQQAKVEPNHVTACCMLNACASIGSSEKGRCIHCYVIKGGLEMDTSVSNSLLDMYGKCGTSIDTCTLFQRMEEPDKASWAILIGSYNRHGYVEEALHVFEKIKEKEIELDGATCIHILQTCSQGVSEENIKEIHNLILEKGMEANSRVGNTLIDMYAKLGKFADAWLVFDRLPQRDIVTWNALIAGYTQHGCYKEALSLFKRLQQEGLEPNEGTYISVFKVCASTAALNQGKRFHEQFLYKGYVLDAFTGSALINMYMSCGSVQDAETVFQGLPKEHIAPWNALLAGYAQHNQYDIATRCFEDFCFAKLSPNSVTYMCLLSVCSHAGSLDQGTCYFKSMRECGIAVLMEHHNLMVGLLCHTHHTAEAEDLLECLHFPSNVVGWTSLLAACRKDGNVEMGERCFRQIGALDDEDKTGRGVHSLMSCVYRKAGMWKDAERVEGIRKKESVWKKPAKAYIEVDKEVHEFMVGDDKHAHIKEIHSKLKALRLQMKEEGYKSHLDPALGHSEKLAMAFGLLSLPSGATIRIVKNLRVCDDCHNTAKFISKVELREIIVQDSYHVHQFKDGFCSCNDLC